MTKDDHRVFGFDLGTNSIGWAVLQEDHQGQATEVLDMGVRIFNKVLEDKTPTPKNQKRRRMRLLRRVLQRRARRRQRLQNYLILLGLLPEAVRSTLQREQALNDLGDPYRLRAAGLTAPLPAFQLGRAILHLGMRRGFQSNRKTLLSDMLDDPDVQDMLAELEQESSEGKSDADQERLKEEGQFKQAIAELQHAIDAAGCATLGAYLAQLPGHERKRNRRVGRDMVRHELRALLQAQQAHHPALSEAVQGELEHIIFYQRPLRWDRSSIGQCSLEKNRPRAAMARLEYQRFRLLQDLNHIRYDYTQINPDTGEIHGVDLPLQAADKQKLLLRMESQREMKWSAVKKLLGLSKTIRFNLENGSKNGLRGNSTACTLQSIIGEATWQNLGADGQQALVEDLLKYEHKRPLKERLVRHWGFAPATAIALASAELEPGHANLSLKAIRRLLPHLEQGLRYDEARVAAGYAYKEVCQPSVTRLPRPQDLRNPVVNKALHEFRRVCNALIATYGQPAAIRIELPRELGLSGKRKAAFEKQQKANTQANEAAEAEYLKVKNSNPQLALPNYPKKQDKLKYRLWQEQGECCFYSGRGISLSQLFSADVEVDHILPYARSLDDSYTNKVLAFAQENRDKSNRTPYEAFQGNPSRWEQIVQRARRLISERKRDNILRQELDGIDGFINSQLVDTGYLSREVYHYVQVLGCDVSVSKGSLTAWLRHSWGLNSLLGGGEKNRADHRHHAVDAAVISVVSRSLYQRLVRSVQQQQGRLDGLAFTPPFPEFRNRLAAQLEQMIVCHDPIHQLSGAFHEETAYGVRPNDQGGERIVYRKPVDGSFGQKQIDKVLDAGLKAQLQAHLDRFGGKEKTAFSPENRPVLHPGQGPLRHVQIIAAESFNPDSFLKVRDAQGRTRKLYPYGNNHHVEILRHKENGKIKSEFVNMWQAAQRVHREKRPMVQRDHGPEWEFLMALHINDLVEITMDGQPRTLRVQALDPVDSRLTLRLHTAATLENKELSIRKSVAVLVDAFKLRALPINILGHRQP